MRFLSSVPVRGAAVSALLLFASWSSTSGQELLRSYAGTASAGEQSRFTALGDINGDGVTDHLVAAPNADGDRGLARVHSGADGTLLASITGDVPGARFGFSVAAVHDVDGDGVPDFAVGAPGSPAAALIGSVFIYSGANAGFIRRINGTQIGSGFGHDVAGLGDIDGDGLADLLISAPFADADRGIVAAFSGGTGGLLAARRGEEPGDQYGISIDGTLATGDGSPEPIIGAVIESGDGSPEPIIGSVATGDGSPQPIVGATQGGNSGPGYIEILSVVDFSVQARVLGAAGGDQFGLSVQQAGDVNADGTLDFIVGASPRDRLGQPTAPGYVQVLSGTDASVMLTLSDGIIGSGFGESVAGIGDCDGDGHDDLMVGAPYAAEARIFSGYDGSLSQLIYGVSGSRFGSSTAFAGDLDGDGKADAGVGSAHGSSGVGTVSVYSLYRWINLAGGMSGESGVPIATGTGSTGSSSSATLSLTNAASESAVTLLVGFSLAFDANLGGLIPNVDLVVSGLVTDATGSLNYALTLPPEMSSGDMIYYQFFVQDPSASSGTSASNPVAARGEG
jgi:hypothetical protein